MCIGLFQEEMSCPTVAVPSFQDRFCSFVCDKRVWLCQLFPPFHLGPLRQVRVVHRKDWSSSVRRTNHHGSFSSCPVKIKLGASLALHFGPCFVEPRPSFVCACQSYWWWYTNVHTLKLSVLPKGTPTTDSSSTVVVGPSSVPFHCLGPGHSHIT